MIEKLDETNFMLYAARNYDNPECFETLEFYDDLKRFKYLKRLLNKYRETGEFKERLILNHVVVLLNLFGDNAAIRMMFVKLKGFHNELFTILNYMNRMPESVDNITHLNITISRNELDLDTKLLGILENI